MNKTETIKAMQAALATLAKSPGVDQSATHDGLTNCDSLAFIRGRLADLLQDAQHDERNAAKKEESERHARRQAASQYESIREMVAGLNLDRDRLEELEDARRPFCAGWNMPGYMPDETPDNFQSWEEARDYIADEMDRYAEECEELTSDEGQDDEARQVKKQEGEDLRTAAQELRNDETGTEYARTVGGFHYFITAAHQDGLDDGDFAEWQELKAIADEFASEEDARERIEEDPLSVEVRSDWGTPGSEDNTPSEFRILLCTGGPAVQIRGELDEHGTPCRAWLEYQDWFTPWAEYHGEHGTPSYVDMDILLSYCQCFYFGEG